MAPGRDLWLLLPAPLRRLPADLAAVVVLTLATLFVVFAPVVNETPIRVAFGLPFVLFLPGYAFVAALFPEEGESPTAGQSGTDAGAATTAADDGDGDEGLFETWSDRSGIDGIERVALSFGLSIAIVPLIGLALNFTPWGIRLVPVAVSVSAFTLGCAAVAARRRQELPPDDRFRVPYRAWLDDARDELFDPDDRTDAALNVLLAASILLAVGSVGYAVAVPPQGEQFTEFYLLTEDEDGELVAAGYPENLTLGEPASVVVGVGNREYEAVEYTVVVQLQNVSTEDNETVVRDRTELDRFQTTLEHNETRHERHRVTPTTSGEDLRLQYLLYRGEPPANPTADDAYRDLHLWVDVRAPGDG